MPILPWSGLTNQAPHCQGMQHLWQVLAALSALAEGFHSSQPLLLLGVSFAQTLQLMALD